MNMASRLFDAMNKTNTLQLSTVPLKTSDYDTNTSTSQFRLFLHLDLKEPLNFHLIPDNSTAKTPP